MQERSERNPHTYPDSQRFLCLYAKCLEQEILNAQVKLRELEADDDVLKCQQAYVSAYSSDDQFALYDCEQDKRFEPCVIDLCCFIDNFQTWYS